MTQEDKQLLIRDLCGRLPYGVKCACSNNFNGEFDIISPLSTSHIDMIIGGIHPVKPYLRPMSSMTEEEKDNLQSLHDIISDENYGDGYSPSAWNAITEWEDYCNARHLDYRGLIPMGLALKAVEGMYKTE